MGFIDKIGKGVKGVIGGMILGVFLLPIGIAMQYCSANQMKYDKVFEKAKLSVDATGMTGIQEIKTRGIPEFENGSVPYEGMEVSSNEGDVFEGKYITFNIQKYKIKETKTQKKDENGNPIANEYTYSYTWITDGTPKNSPSDIKIKANGFSAEFNNFRQNYIPTKTAHYRYIEFGGDSGIRSVYGNYSNKIDVTTYDKNSPKPSATAELYKQFGYYNGLSKFYVVEFTGRVYKDNAQVTLCGKAIGSQLSVIEGGSGGKMLAISYSDFAGITAELKSSAKTEGTMKFVFGTICFILGFAGLFGPIIKVLDFIPFLGKLAIKVIYFILAVVSFIISLLFYFFFKFFWLILAAAIIIPIVLVIINKKKQKTA